MGRAVLPTAVVTTSAGELTEPTVQFNHATGGFRVAFVFDPKETDQAEFRLVLEPSNNECAEVWLYRWSRGG